MLLRIYSIYDTKAGVYAGTFFEVNNAVAMRRFADLVNDPRSPLNRHPADYILFGIGVMNDENAKIEGHDPVNLCTAEEVKVKDDSNVH